MAYEKSPALAAYLRRIGADELSFKRFVVKEFVAGYPLERALIRLADGKVKCSTKEHAPTDEERTAIEAALVGADFPHSIGARDLTDLRPLLDAKAEATYEIWDRQTDLIVMVQQMIRIDDGSKAYPPWSLWSDGKWRRMEPDGRLPLYKPRHRTQAARLMIHEGAKAAAAVAALDKAHPWQAEMSLYEHWGLLGGALAPHRSYYEEISREGFNEVAYFCDNDWPGQAALQEVSRAYGRAMKGIRPDDRFPQSWDAADPLPAPLYRGDRWVGPSVRDLTVPATWATEKPPKGGARLRREFKEEWLHVVTPEAFVHRDWPDRLYTKTEFNNRIAPFSEVANTAGLIQRDDAAKGGVLKYSPAEASGIYATAEAGRHVNTHVPTTILAEKGDPRPWLEFLEHLVPLAEDRRHLMRWCATLIALPEVKMLWGILMISSTQGVGKGTLGEKILSPLVGLGNVSSPSEQEIVDSNYNYWLAHKRLAVIHEIYAGHSAKAYNRLKSVITDKYVSVSRKYMANYEIENWIHVFACSNSMKAIQLSVDDRRWFLPKVAEKKRLPGYWAEFNAWLTDRGGLGIIRWWASEYVKVPENRGIKGEDAPGSALKMEVIDDGMSAPATFVTDVVRGIIEVIEGQGDDARAIREKWRQDGFMVIEGEGIFFLDTAMQDLVMNKFYQGRRDEKLLKPATIRKIAERCGLHVGRERVGTFKPWGLTWSGARIVATDPVVATKTAAEIWTDNHHQRPLNLKMYEEM